MRRTVQRQVILDAVQKLHIHPTAEDIYRKIHAGHPNISKATVYRNLHQLVETGETRLVLLPDSPERFDARLSHHYHFRCRTCSAIFDVDMDYLAGLDTAVQDTYGFQVDDHDVVFQGVCERCKSKGGG